KTVCSVGMQPRTALDGLMFSTLHFSALFKSLTVLWFLIFRRLSFCLSPLAYLSCCSPCTLVVKMPARKRDLAKRWQLRGKRKIWIWKCRVRRFFLAAHAEASLSKGGLKLH